MTKWSFIPAGNFGSFLLVKQSNIIHHISEETKN